MPADQARPDEAAIRRALAECMTVGDIDDALGWAPGTARRRRWLAPDRGGLPYADAEIGGTALWFRATFEAWQSTLTARRRRRAPAVEPVVPESAGDRPSGSETGPRDTTDREQPSESPPESSDDEPRLEQPEPSGAERSGAEPSVETDAPAATPAGPPPAVVSSGFELAVGQRVVADVHGDWRAAVVAHRDKTTVMVEYQLDDSPLGARRQRIGTDRVRLPTEDE